MKLDYVLVACNDNKHYLDFWPAVKTAWQEVVGVLCYMIYVGEALPENLKTDPGVIWFKPIEGWPTATQAQVIRLLYPALLDCSGAVMISDMDMIPMQSGFFRDGLSLFSDSQFVSLRGIDEHEKQIYMCYVAATPRTWRDMFKIETIEDIRSVMTALSQQYPADGMHGGNGWCTDQIVLYKKVKEWQRDLPERVGLIPWTPQIPRLDRGNPMEWFYWTELLETKIMNKAYIDFHMPPYEDFRDNIDNILKYTIYTLRNALNS